MMNLLKRKRKQKGMTLIEVMVVIASSLVLAGVVFSVGKTIRDRAKVQESKELILAIRESMDHRMISFDSTVANNIAQKAVTWVPGWDIRANTVKSGLKGSFGNVFVTITIIDPLNPNVSGYADSFSVDLAEVPVEYCTLLVGELSKDAAIIAVGNQKINSTAPFHTRIDPQTAHTACNAEGTALVTVRFFFEKQIEVLPVNGVTPNYNPPPPSGLPVWTP